ncbi:DUF4406 domain-containing protein [Kineococcus sp. SYSU DK006]|uniref:DUF4406 domain-containing protein n=1 Tax=Kineococcus sp. SYSU DK006 TaxID=3383127 RepID=UPI003D7DF2E1
MPTTTTEAPPSTRPLLILIAGPYRSGTGDDPALLEANLRRLEEAAWPIFRRGHVPMIGEWVALPVLRGGGGDGPAHPLAEQVMYPTAQRLLQHCDGVLRLPGASRGADQDVAIAEDLGLPIYHDVEQIPFAATHRGTLQGS